MTEFNRTTLKQCNMTKLMLPVWAFPYLGSNSNRSVLGYLFLNVSRRAVNGRYHATALLDEKSEVGTYARKGIRMAARWVDDPTLFGFEILSHIGLPPTPYHSLDRIDNRGNYDIGNLRWADPYTQAQNRGTLTGREAGF